MAYITGMDMIARAFMIADDILENSDYKKLRSQRYASFDSGKGKEFEQGDLTLENLRELALKHGEPKQLSGKQEFYERILASYWCAPPWEHLRRPALVICYLPTVAICCFRENDN
jgi:xylose isomerase